MRSEAKPEDRAKRSRREAEERSELNVEYVKQMFDSFVRPVLMRIGYNNILTYAERLIPLGYVIDSNLDRFAEELRRLAPELRSMIAGLIGVTDRKDVIKFAYDVLRHLDEIDPELAAIVRHVNEVYRAKGVGDGRLGAGDRWFIQSVLELWDRLPLVLR